MDDEKKRLHAQLVKLGDMMGDGLHLEPDGKWISRDYKKILRALGISAPRRNNGGAINQAMAEALKTARCTCGAELKQSRSGSMRADCTRCESRYQFKRGRKASGG